MQNNRYKKNVMHGFSLIEVLIASSLIIIITLVTVSAFLSFRRTADLNSVIDGALGTLRDAERQTIESKNADQWSVHVESGRIVLFKGATFSEGASENIVFSLPPGISITNISLTGGGSDIIFNRIVGDTVTGGSFVVQRNDTPGNNKTISVSSTGLIQAQ